MTFFKNMFQNKNAQQGTNPFSKNNPANFAQFEFAKENDAMTDVNQKDLDQRKGINLTEITWKENWSQFRTLSMDI
ncbi:hypothetical protein M1K46_24675 [Fictibacillus sp. WQ 8-8]|uniref:hypothetical protein n=1 Tax=Fictibacillus sp. WQ 8-8 TaxID=2938788 RepID=UPI00210E3613|nr:hypothetical protein [Fictibacillus sp. WQ 8-8]MCQ6268769.1 hypothetical protein [Fictibacillus sp. WQ 8-8]